MYFCWKVPVGDWVQWGMLMTRPPYFAWVAPPPPRTHLAWQMGMRRGEKSVCMLIPPSHDSQKIPSRSFCGCVSELQRPCCYQAISFPPHWGGQSCFFSEAHTTGLEDWCHLHQQRAPGLAHSSLIPGDANLSNVAWQVQPTVWRKWPVTWARTGRLSCASQPWVQRRFLKGSGLGRKTFSLNLITSLKCSCQHREPAPMNFQACLLRCHLRLQIIVVTGINS